MGGKGTDDEVEVILCAGNDLLGGLGHLDLLGLRLATLCPKVVQLALDPAHGRGVARVRGGKVLPHAELLGGGRLVFGLQILGGVLVGGRVDVLGELGQVQSLTRGHHLPKQRTART